MRILGNILWLILGGLGIALEYFVGGVLLCLTIIGIPFGLQLFKLGIYAIWPFGSEVVNAEGEVGCLSALMNVIWVLIGGIWIALQHIVLGLLLTITIVGIPWGSKHFKMAALALLPFGKEIR